MNAVATSWRTLSERARDFGRGANPRLGLALTINSLLPPLAVRQLRVAILRLGGLQFGARTTFGGRIHVAGGPRPAAALTIGDDCFVNEGCWFDTAAPITVEHDVYLAHEVAVITSTHHIGAHDRRAYGSVALPVVIGAGAWIGARATILPGVTIGAGTVVGAGAVVTRSLPPDVLALGVPARVARPLGETEVPGESAS